ncbi:MAG: MFS transporter [Candidatus Heimdallarchaeota archaeon]
MDENENILTEEEDTKSEVSEYKAYKYRWVVLILFMFVGAVTQLIWVTYGTIIDESAGFFGVDELWIVVLALVFMVVYIPVNFLACWVIDKLGLKWGTGIGVILTGVFGFLRAFALFGPNFWLLLVFHIMCAVGQPFVMNSFTKLASTWFPQSEKTMASGLGTMSLFVGVLIAFLVPPLAVNKYGVGPAITWITWIFGIVALVAMVLYLIFVRNKPPTPPNAYADKTKALAVEGTRSMFKKKDFNLLFVIILIGAGAFNAISAVLDVIFEYPIGAPQPGIIGALIIGGGTFGAFIFSTLSDHFQKRKPFLIMALVAGAILLPLLYFIQIDSARFAISFFLGFFLVSALPVGLTYAAELTYPLPEETSNGIMMWIGQISGIILLACIMVTDIINESGSLMFINIIVLTALFVVGIVLSFFMKDLDAHKL